MCLFFDLCKNLIMEKKEPAKPKGKAAAAKTVDKFTQVQNVKRKQEDKLRKFTRRVKYLHLIKKQ